MHVCVRVRACVCVSVCVRVRVELDGLCDIHFESVSFNSIMQIYKMYVSM